MASSPDYDHGADRPPDQVRARRDGAERDLERAAAEVARGDPDDRARNGDSGGSPQREAVERGQGPAIHRGFPPLSPLTHKDVEPGLSAAHTVSAMSASRPRRSTWSRRRAAKAAEVRSPS